jgi:hypothetical protein
MSLKMLNILMTQYLLAGSANVLLFCRVCNVVFFRGLSVVPLE